MSTSIGGHHSARMITDVWLTPPEIITCLGPFNTDPCAAPEPRPWQTAERHICLPEDGLAAEWTGRVWLNPPYSRDAVHWLRRLSEHGHGTALVFARTETIWFVEYVWKCATSLLFLDGRIYFRYPDGTRPKFNAGAPSVLVAYGEYDSDRLRTSGLAGTFVRPERLSD